MILERPEEPGKKYALALTVLVHLMLVSFLFFGVQWKRSKPEVYDVELWAPTPQPAQYIPPSPPPPPPEPEVKPLPKPEPKPEIKVEPPPKKPEIVVKEEKKKPERIKNEPQTTEPKVEQKKPEAKPEVKKQEAKIDPFKEMLEREDRLLKSSSAKANANAQQMANAAAAEAEQRSTSNKRALDDYRNKIRLKIKSNIPSLPSIQGNPEAVFEVSQLPTREILDVRLKRSSGNPALDAAIERAIRNSSPLPAPSDPSLFRRELEIKYRPFEE